MVRRAVLAITAVAAALGAPWAHAQSTGVYLVVPEPPLATVLSEDTYEDFLRSTDKTGIVFRYPSASIFGSVSTVEFAVVTKILENNPKCKLGMYRVDLSINSPAELMTPCLSYLKNGELVTFRDNVSKVAEILAWITRERICEMKLFNTEIARYYIKSLERGRAHTYLLMHEGLHDPKLHENVYNTIVNTGLRVPFMLVDKDEVITYLFQQYHLSEDAIKTNAVLVARNVPTLNKIQFYWQHMNDMDKLRSFLFRELIPPVHGTNSYMIEELFTLDKTIVYIYTKEEMLEERIDVPWLNKFARKHNDRFVFIHSKGDSAVEERLNQLLVIDGEYVDTAVRAFELHPEKAEFVKFKPLDLPDGTITQVKLMNFINDLRKGKIRHFVKSEPAIPENIDTGHVKTIVGEDFHRRVIESDEDILVVFYSPWCGHCHIAKRVFRDLGRRLKGVNSLVIAKFDAFNNEVENMVVNSFPVIMLYPHNAKNEPVLYEGQINTESLAVFLERECKKRYVAAATILERNVGNEQLFEMHTEL